MVEWAGAAEGARKGAGTDMDLESRLQRPTGYAASKGFAHKNYFLDCIRRGQACNITAVLAGPVYIREMEALFGDDLELALLSYAYVWSQAQHAAVEGGLDEESATRIYTRSFMQSKRLAAIREFAELNIQTLVDFADAVAATKEDTRFSSLVRRCHGHIREHVYEQLTVNQIAEALHFSRSHLAHIFKSETGKTMVEAIQEEKIAEATWLIESSSLSLTEIGLKLGFCSQSHFTRVFRKVAGTTPSEWRRARRPAG